MMVGCTTKIPMAERRKIELMGIWTSCFTFCAAAAAQGSGPTSNYSWIIEEEKKKR